MKKRFYSFLTFWGIFLSFFAFGWINIHSLYAEYAKLAEYRRIHPDFIPSSAFMRISSAGHSTTYADMTWISMIQYIGDNIGTQKYLDFSPVIIDRIHDIHPYFMKPYELSLLLLPWVGPAETGSWVEKKRELTRATLASLENRLPYICESEKVDKIALVTQYQDLWTNPIYRDPCRDGMIAYYMAFHYYNDLDEWAQAKEYYKIAAAQTSENPDTPNQAPLSSRYLIGLMDGKSGNYLTSAFSLISLAVTGEDDDRFLCLKSSSDATKLVLDSIHEGGVSMDRVRQWSALEQALSTHPNEKKSKTPTVDCRDYFSRATRQYYLAYVETEARAMKAQTGRDPQNQQDLEWAGFLSFLPRILESDGKPALNKHYIKNPLTGIWEYTIYTYEDIIRSKDTREVEKQ